MDCENKRMVIRHVQGNVLRLAIPLTLRSVSVSGGLPAGQAGEATYSDEDFVPEGAVTVTLKRGTMSYPFTAVMDGHVAMVEDQGTLPVGVYSVTVECRDEDGAPLRFKRRGAVCVVDATADAGVEPGVEFEAGSRWLDAAVFLPTEARTGGARSDWEETDADSMAYILNKPDLASLLAAKAGFVTFTDKAAMDAATANDGTIALDMDGEKFYIYETMNGEWRMIADSKDISWLYSLIVRKQDNIADLAAIRAGASRAIPGKVSELENDLGYGLRLTRQEAAVPRGDGVDAEGGYTPNVELSTDRFVVLIPGEGADGEGAWVAKVGIPEGDAAAFGPYQGKFTKQAEGEGVSSFAYPATVKAADGNPDELEDGHVYEFHILDGVIVVADVTASE